MGSCCAPHRREKGQGPQGESSKQSGIPFSPLSGHWCRAAARARGNDCGMGMSFSDGDYPLYSLQGRPGSRGVRGRWGGLTHPAAWPAWRTPAAWRWWSRLLQPIATLPVRHARAANPARPPRYGINTRQSAMSSRKTAARVGLPAAVVLYC